MAVCATLLKLHRVLGVCAGEGTNMDFGGFFFGDLYYVPSHRNSQGSAAPWAVMRRLLLTTVSKFSDQWSGRAQLEAYHEGEFEKCNDVPHSQLGFNDKAKGSPVVERALSDHHL
jgi:hypothetical protein